VTITGGQDGNGVLIAFPPTDVWHTQQQRAIACGAVLDPTYSSGGDGGGNDCTPTRDENGNPVIECNPDGGTGGSPIIIDTTGEGFQLTSLANGVVFDLPGNGHPKQMPWTARGSRNGFLALDRNGDGHITSGKELFGNFAAQDRSAHPNGFLALAEFDEPDQGGNGDGIIDEHDAVFSKLRIWIDENHDGISQPGELHTLPELGIRSLSLSYFESRRTDEFGNQFRYKARVNPRKEQRDERDETKSGEPGRWTYDVFFTAK
jgi:hypothetical protein